ncbi:hypothetical protein Tco_1534353 [Tanacetum coccineum]
MQPVAPPSPNYVPGPEHPPSPVEVPYVPKPEYPEYLAPSDAETPLEDQLLPADASPTALSPGYVADSDPEEDPEEDHVDYPADGGDDDEPSGDDDDDTNDEDEEPFEDEDDDEEEEHLLSPQIRIPFAQTRLRRVHKTVRLEPPMSPSMEARIAEYAVAPAPPSPPPSPLSPWSPPLSQIPSPPLPPPPSSLHLPPPVPTSLPLPSLPRPPLPVSLFIPPPVDREEDIPEDKLPPRKRLCSTAPTSRIRDTWVDPREAAKEVAPTTLEGVNTKVTELAAVQEQDTHDIYAVIEDTQDWQTRIFQSVEALVIDRQYHYETAQLLNQEALVSQEAWAHSVGLRVINSDAGCTGFITTGHLATALGEIRALQTRDQTRADAPKGTGSSA